MLYLVERFLRQRFGNPRHGNKYNPLSELLYILLSLQTTETNCRGAYVALRRRFPRWSMLSRATVAQIRKPIDFAGLGQQRSRKIKAIVSQIVKDRGGLSLSFLRRLGTHEAERYLTSLPGVGKKTARCILMYSFGQHVFPLDTHCARVLRRLRFPIAPGSLRKCEDQIQAMIPPELRQSLHVTMVSLGRTVCTSQRPKCGICPLVSICPTGKVQIRKN
jgi:endonuclease III